MYAAAVAQLLQQHQVVLVALVLFVIFFTAARPVRGASRGRHAHTASRGRSARGQAASAAPAQHNQVEAVTVFSGTEVSELTPERELHASGQSDTTATLPQAVPPTPCVMRGGTCGTHSTQQPPVGHIPTLSRGCSAKPITDPSTECVHALCPLETESSHYLPAECTEEEAADVVDIVGEQYAGVGEPELDEVLLCIDEQEASVVDLEELPPTKEEPEQLASTVMYCIAVDQVFPHSIARTLQHG
ncbi:hypothetical protein ACIS_00083 [Anaplasma centrale str. Israel]|uniref:Uncharacterized protein n=1 Tax=Anaplasma centrale (strain Israel) TaxID=574556 RepID=D1ATB1_ANACI|nr:hypothetical protein [Anaplasma centrale]ACZ48789.1 hypothetical protein ACIS_00083 [Anaplasma centrale str. Israel]